MFVLVLIGVFLLVYSPHFSYKFPIHADEWFHTALSKNLTNIDFEHPEFGYHVFLSVFFAVTKVLGMDFILAYKFLPALFAVFASVVLFIFMYKLTKSFFVSIFSMIFLASLPSNVNLLGLWFAVPLTLAIPLVYLFFYFFVHGMRKENFRNIIYATIVLFFIFLIHAPSASFMFPVILIYMFINRKKIHSSYFIVFIPFFLFALLLLGMMDIFVQAVAVI